MYKRTCAPLKVLQNDDEINTVILMSDDLDNYSSIFLKLRSISAALLRTGCFRIIGFGHDAMAPISILLLQPAAPIYADEPTMDTQINQPVSSLMDYGPRF